MISIVAAIADNMAIGCGGKLPWHIPVDMKHFKELTSHNTVIMGAKTYSSLGRPLPDRENIVLSTRETRLPGARVFSSLPEALAFTSSRLKVFVIGGHKVFEAAVPIAHSMHITRVHCTPQADTYFPDIDWGVWDLITDKRVEPDERNAFPVNFEFYLRS